MIGLLNLDSHMNKHYSNRMVVKRWGTEFNILLFSNIVMRITNSNLWKVKCDIKHQLDMHLR